MPRTRLILPNTIEREVPVLFPNTRLEVTSAEVEYYRSHNPYAFALDRQSIPKQSTKKDATGMRRRVEACVDFAREENLYLPVPEYRADKEEGQLPFLFGEECQRFWFVDGTKQRSTGFAANPNARPQLWRAFLLAQALAKHGCGPKWLLIGEGTRLFREPQWLSTFCRALWHHKVRIFSGGFGEVHADNYAGFEAYIKALSGWLKTVNAGYRRFARDERIIPHTYPPFGLAFTKDRRHVTTDPEQWAIITEMVRLIARGDIKSCLAASRWLNEAHGVHRSYAWVLEYLKRSYLDGQYVCGDKEYVQRLLSQGGLFYDLDISEGGHPRRLVRERDGLTWQIEHALSGTQPIDPDIIKQARARVLKNPGRPRKNPDPQSIPQRLLRCAVCGYGIEEGWTTTNRLPYMMCRVLDNQIRAKKVSKQEARSLSICQHERHRPGHASDIVFRVLFAGLKNRPVETDRPIADPAARRVALETDLARAEAAFLDFQARCGRGEMGDQSNRMIRLSVETQRETLMGAVTEAQKQLEVCCAEYLLTQKQNAQLQEVALSLSGLEADDFDEEGKRRLVVAVVEKVDVDLASGQFVIYLNFGREQLEGALPKQEEIISPPTLIYNFCFVLRGTLPPLSDA